MTKLLIETSHEVEMLTEETATGKQLFIEGIFAQADVKNGNGRIYERSIMNEALDRYNNEYVTKRRALGELNHPDRPFADPANASILIREMRWEPNGRDIYGKALVMDTPQGQIVKGLMQSGFNLGVSTRGLGSVKESQGVKYVQKGFFMTAVDCVDNPSGPDCYVNALSESKTSWVQKNGVWVPINEENMINEDQFFDTFDKWLRSLRK